MSVSNLCKDILLLNLSKKVSNKEDFNYVLVGDFLKNIEPNKGENISYICQVSICKFPFHDRNLEVVDFDWMNYKVKLRNFKKDMIVKSNFSFY